MKMDSGGYIYLIKENGDNMLHKIGVTRSSDVMKRLKKLQTGNGNELILLSTFWTDRPYRLEKMLHSHFDSNREEGEWFLLSKDDVDGFIPLCEKLQERMDILKENPFF